MQTERQIRAAWPFFNPPSDGQRFKNTAGTPNLTHGSHWRWKGSAFLELFSPGLFSSVSSVSAPFLFFFKKGGSSSSAALWMFEGVIHRYTWFNVKPVTHARMIPRRCFKIKVQLWDALQVTWQQSLDSTAAHTHAHTRQQRLHEHNDVTISNTQD